LTLLRLLLHLKEEKKQKSKRITSLPGYGCTGGFSAVYLWCSRLSEGLEEMGQSMKGFLSKCTTNRFAAVLTGSRSYNLPGIVIRHHHYGDCNEVLES